MYVRAATVRMWDDATHPCWQRQKMKKPSTT